MRFFLGFFVIFMFLYTAVYAAPVNRVVAVVNGDMITEFDLNRVVAPVLLRAGLDPRNESDKPTVDKLRRDVLQSQIRDMIVAQEAERLHVTVSEEDVDAEIKAFRERANITEEQFAEQLKAQKMSNEEFRVNIRKSVLSQNLLSHMVARKVVITREEIERYYNEHPEIFSKGRTFHFAMLVYPSFEDASKWGSRVKSSKIAFADAVREISIGPRREDGGDVGEMSFGDMSTELQECFADMKAGDISDIFQMNGMYTQTYLIEIKESGSGQDIDAVAPQIEAILREPRLKERFVEYLEQLTGRAVVDIRL